MRKRENMRESRKEGDRERVYGEEKKETDKKRERSIKSGRANKIQREESEFTRW